MGSCRQLEIKNSASGLHFLSGGESRIRTLEGVAGGFTVRSHWPLGQPAKVVLVIRREQVTLITALGANQGRQSAVDSPIIYGQSE